MRKNSIFTSGFGLMELMVSISIMIVITSVIMARHDSFNAASLLRGQAYAIALQAREVQLNAISATMEGGFRNVFGLHFDTVNNPNGYAIFKDADSGGTSNNYYDAAEVHGKQGVVDRRFYIRAIRLMSGSAVSSTPTNISISFKRPNFDARIYTSAGNEAASTVSGVEIDIGVVGKADVRTVEITKTGQISVKGL
jgi:type II secretory pathway pseudopilin PulG